MIDIENSLRIKGVRYYNVIIFLEGYKVTLGKAFIRNLTSYTLDIFVEHSVWFKQY